MTSNGPIAREMRIRAKVRDGALLAKRQEYLTRTSLKLFLEHGFHRTSVRQICEASGWEMGTLYLYVSSKEDILWLVAESIVRDRLKAIEGLPGDLKPPEALEWVIRRTLNWADGKRQELNLLYRESASLRQHEFDELKRIELEERDFIAKILEIGQASGHFDPVLNPRVVAHDVIMMGHGWAIKAWALDQECDFKGFGDHQVHLFLKGVALRER